MNKGCGRRSGIGESFWMAEEQVAGCLGGPRSGWVRGDSGVEDFACGDVDEEQQIVAAQECGVDGGEVAGDCSLGSEELGPGHGGAGGCGVDAVVFEDPPDN